MIFNMIGGGGGGASLNFKVVGGTTQPASATENTIWVNTDSEITSWCFSVTEPTEPVEGMVWIKIGTISDVAFNALKENDLRVYPLSAKQYISGAWVDVTAKSYQNGAWVDWYVWDNYLYKSGDQYERITGGWVDRRVDGYWGTDNKIEFREDCIYIYANYGSIAAVSTANKKDLTDFNSVNIVTISGSTNWKLFVSEGGVNAAATLTAYVAKTSGSLTATLDISDLSGEYYIGVLTGHSATNSQAAYISEVWFE